MTALNWSKSNARNRIRQRGTESVSGARSAPREFEGLALVDIRKHYTAADGTMQPTKKELSIAIARLPDLAKAINQAVVKAIELGLIKDAEGGDG
jgi:Transcriptional Coactivator p15 (PC4)